MAKHIVKCPYCNQQFDANAEPYEKVGRRYAHPQCYQKYMSSLTQEDIDKKEFYDYAKIIFKDDYNYVLTKKLAERYVVENGYTYSGMTKALKWYYEIMRNSTENSNGSIGILPFIYLKARNYYYDLFITRRANEDKDILEYIPKVKELNVDKPSFVTKKIRLFNLEES